MIMKNSSGETDALLEYPWHKASWEQLFATYLPELIGAHCDLRRYDVDRSSDCYAVLLELEGVDSVVTVEYRDIPMPDDRGVFVMDNTPVMIFPIAHGSLADVRCAGEQLRDFLAVRVTPLPVGIVTNSAAVEAWLPLKEWITDFFQETASRLDTINCIAEGIHLRRLRLSPVGDFTPSDIAPEHQIGLLCPIEIPTGPNCGLVFTVAQGAEIRNGAVIRKDAEPSQSLDPTSMLGPTASYIPFIEKSDPARLISGANMIRQWLVPLVHEPALVQTGTEPHVPELWCGFNLLTAFASFGRLTYAHGIVVSESAAARMRYSNPLAIGDKLSNRHGQAGVISRILPDDKMPTLPDGRTVELLLSFSELHTNMNTGQLWEAVYSWLVSGGYSEPIVHQFSSPTSEEIETALQAADLPKHGMVKLTLTDKTETERPVVVGTVYWGRTAHIAVDKLTVAGSDHPRQVQGEMEYWALRDNGAFSSVSELNGLIVEGGTALADAVHTIERGESPAIPEESIKLLKLTEKLRLAGVQTRYGDNGLSFAFADTRNDESVLVLPEPVSHPWRAFRALSEIPRNPESPLWDGLERMTERLRALLESDAPEKLVESSRRALNERVTQYYDELVVHMDFVPRGRLHFSGRGLMVPAVGIAPHQIGIPEEMAWVLFGPHVAARVGPEAMRMRTPEAKVALESIMSTRWIRTNRGPTINLTAMLAFQPVVVNHRAIELHPLVCRWINAVFVGLQIAVIHPLADTAQRDAAEKLSIVGHLRRDPELVRTLVPTQDSLWGLAELSRHDSGRSQLKKALTRLPEMPDGYLTEKQLGDCAVALLADVGPDRILEILETVYDLGLSAAMQTGGSMNPFMRLPNDVGSSRDEVIEAFEKSDDFDNPAFGTQLLLIKSGARGSIDNLVMLCHSRTIDPGLATHIPDSIPLHSQSMYTSNSSTKAASPEFTTTGYLDGLTIQDLIRATHGAGSYIRKLQTDMDISGHTFRSEKQPKGYGILARATRADRPGVVIASAAETGEIDPLLDVDAKLFTGRRVDPDQVD
jgi:hypothetical protein